MSTWTFFDEKTGLPLGRTFGGRDADLEANTPEGAVAVPGLHDYRNRKLEDGKVIPFQPPQPSDDHEWNEVAELWVVKAEALERDRKDAIARRSIQSIESMSQRAVREALLLVLPDGPEKQRLQDADDAIAEQRVDITDTRLVSDTDSAAGSERP